MDKCKPVAMHTFMNEKHHQLDGSEKEDATLFRSLVGSLIYLTHTRPDIAQLLSCQGS